VFVLQVYLKGLSQPMSLVFNKYDAAAEAAGGAAVGKKISDDYGGELFLRENPAAILIIDQDRFFTQQSDMDLANKKAMHKHMQRLQADPTLRFLQGQGQFKSPLVS